MHQPRLPSAIIRVPVADLKLDPRNPRVHMRGGKSQAKGALGQSKVTVLQCIRTVRDNCQDLDWTNIPACAPPVILSAIGIVGDKSPSHSFGALGAPSEEESVSTGTTEFEALPEFCNTHRKVHSTSP